MINKINASNVHYILEFKIVSTKQSIENKIENKYITVLTQITNQDMLHICILAKLIERQSEEQIDFLRDLTPF